MSDISVVIPTFNRLWALPQAVESCRSAGGNVEIVVVDDGSVEREAVAGVAADDFLPWLQQRLPYLASVYVGENFRFGRGRMGDVALLIQLSAMGGGRVLTVKPNFALYGLDARLLGAELTEVPLREDQSVDFDALIAALGQASGPAARGVIYLPRPHAPTGSLCSLGDVERLALASQGWLLVIDEAYHHFMDSEDARALARRHPHVVLLRTLSKAWGLAGLRMGYALTSDGVARQLRKLVPPFGVSVLQTVCTLVALEHPGYVQARVAHTLRERERLFLALQRHPSWQPMPSHANFLLVRTPDAAQAHAQLLAGGVLVRRQDSLPGLHGCLRVTVGTTEENDAFLRAAGLGSAQ